MSETILSMEDKKSLEDLNRYLKRKTGIDFLERLVNLGFSENRTELDAHNFITENYPVKKNLSEKDKQNISLLNNFYATAVKVYDSTEREPATCVCEPKKTPWEDNFRARSMNVFLQNTCAQEKSMAIQFFPLS